MSEKQASEKLKEWKKNFVMPVKGSNRIYSSKKTIERFYELISMLYTAFFRNRLYSEAFGLPDSKKITINPIELKKFISLYLMHNDKLSISEFSHFHGEIISQFGGRFKQFIEHFILSEDNLSANPLFIKLDKSVLISQEFTELFSYVLHAIVNKNEFNAETNRRSKIFELQIVKENFEKQGYRYMVDYSVKKKMQIDGIAVSENIVYVIEAKGWGSKKLIEEISSKEILDREIKDSINGIHLDVDSGRRKTGVPLPKKVEWVSEHRKKFRISDKAKIIGLLAINEPPTITEYKSCHVVFVDDFEWIKSGIKRVPIA